MHYHSEIVEAFKSVYGANFIRMMKPSPQDEVWIGFDQGWTRTTLTSIELKDALTSAIQKKSKSLDSFYFGYFMQFKTVQMVTRDSRYCPPNYAIPYYRSEISLHKEKASNISQHTTLLRLSRIRNAFVYYACPMIFSPDEVYDKPDTDKLRLVPINNAPANWRSIDRHFITFQDIYDNSPLWCSDPIGTSSIDFKEFMNRKNDYHPQRMNGEELISLLNSVRSNLIESDKEGGFDEVSDYDESMPKKYIRTNIIPYSFTILEFSSA